MAELPSPSDSPAEPATPSESLNASAAAPADSPATPMSALMAKMMEGILIQYDVRVQAVFRSQDEVAAQMARLHEAIELFNSFSGFPSLSQYAQRLSSLRAQLQATHTTLLAVQKRLLRLHHEVTQRNASVAIPHGLPFGRASLADTAADRISSLFRRIKPQPKPAPAAGSPAAPAGSPHASTPSAPAGSPSAALDAASPAPLSSAPAADADQQLNE